MIVSAVSLVVWLAGSAFLPGAWMSPIELPVAALAAVGGFLASLPVRDTTTQYGSVYFLRGAKGTEMGLSIIKPSVKIVHFEGGNGTIYDPASAKKFNTFSTGNDKAKSESFLTLGFGGSGKDLERAWDIKLLGTEDLQDNGATVATDKLDLVAKDPSVKQMFSHVVIWVDPVRGISLKQESTTPEGDKRTVTYSHIRYNDPKLDVKKYAFLKK